MDALRASTACSPRWPIIIAAILAAIKLAARFAIDA